MLSVLVEEGYEKSVYAAESVDLRSDGRGGLMVRLNLPDDREWIFREGNVFVMNDKGATIAKFNPFKGEENKL